MKKILILFTSVFLSLYAGATYYNFIYDGIAYRIVKELENNHYYVAITYKDDAYNSYTGDIIIPHSFTREEWDSQKGDYITKYYTVTTIGDSAFAYCSDLTSVSISSGYTSIYTSISIKSTAFVHCASLTSVSLHGVDSIYNGAFNDCTNLESVSMYGIQFCNFAATFNGCDKLESVFIYSSSNYKADGDIVYNATETNVVYVPLGIKGHVTLPNTITSISSSSAFIDHTNITGITLPGSLTDIVAGAFHGCTNLDTVICLATTPPAIAMGDGFETSTYDNAYISIPCESYNEYITANGWKQFLNLTSNVVGGVRYQKTSDSTVQVIANRQYGGEVTIPSEVDIYFYHCDTNTSTYKVTTIADNAFANCTDLTAITIPPSVEWIGASAFADCTNLTTINYNAKEIPNESFSLTFGKMWLDGSDNIETVNIGDSVIFIPDYFMRSKTNIKNISIGKNVTTIGAGAFYNCKNIEDITIPSSVTAIDGWAFAFCSNLKNITLENSFVGAKMFYNCTALNSITIPNNIKSIDDSAFANCKSLTTVNYNVDSCQISKNWFKGSNIKNINIGDSVKYIPKYFMVEQHLLNEITIPENVTYIDSNAFYYCGFIKTLNYNADSCFIPYPYLTSGNSLKEVNIGNNVKIIPNYFISKQYSVNEISLPDSITAIGDSAFYDCRFDEITIPDSCVKIGNRAFANCYGLTNITIPKNVTELGYGIFSNCKNITDITFQNTIIGDGMFSNCSGLTKITIPNSITTIRNYAFAFHMNIDTVICEGTTPASLGENIFQYSNYGPYDITLIVPCGSKDTYEASGWSVITNITETCNITTYTDSLFVSICDNESYDFLGNNLTSAGIYSDTIHVTNEIDSVYILTIAINPTFDIVIYDTLNIDEKGENYTDTIVNNLYTISGCDSVVTTITTYILDNSIDTIINNITMSICDNETYLFNGKELSNAGTYYDTVYIDTYKDSITVLTLVVNPTFDTAIYDTILINEVGENYEDVITDNLQTINGCDSVVTTHIYYIYTSGIDKIKQTEVISIYPNPTKDNVTIQGASGEITIINSKGQIIKTVSTNNSTNTQTTIDVSDFESRVYYVKCGKVTKKLVVK